MIRTFHTDKLSAMMLSPEEEEEEEEDAKDAKDNCSSICCCFRFFVLFVCFLSKALRCHDYVRFCNNACLQFYIIMTYIYVKLELFIRQDELPGNRRLHSHDVCIHVSPTPFDPYC